MTIEDLYNRGVWVLNKPAAAAREKTVVVLGAPRGGTSMIAGALHHLGVVMGDRLSPVFEDMTLSEAVENGDLARIDAVVAERNAQHAVWGWKRPGSIHSAGLWRSRFRHPHYVVVFRDLFVIANRNRISMQAGVMRNMRRSHEHFGLILDFIAEQPAPMLLVSYEKAMDDPAYFVRELRDFVECGDEAAMQRALKFIEPNPENYLRASRITDGAGVLDELAERRISGWAMYKKAPKKPVKVRIQINGARDYVVLANQRRDDQDPGEGGRHRGFVLQLSEQERLRPGDQVSVRVAGDIADLPGSPRTFAGATSREASAP